MRRLLGFAAGLAVWALMFWIIPDGFLGMPNRPIVFVEGTVEVRNVFGAIMAVVSLPVLPFVGAKIAAEQDH